MMMGRLQLFSCFESNPNCSSVSRRIRWITVLTVLAVFGRIVAWRDSLHHIVFHSPPPNEFQAEHYLSQLALESTSSRTTRASDSTDESALISGVAADATTSSFHFTNNSNSNNNNKEFSNRTVLFVHVGKAGGETMKNILEMGCLSRKNKRRRRECLEQIPHSRLSEVVGGYFHCFSVRPFGFAKQAKAYLFNVRHPVDRAVSWYRYVQPGNCQPGISDPSSPNCLTRRQEQANPDGWVGRFFRQCFPTVNDWAMASHSSVPVVAALNQKTTTPVNCTQMAQETFVGTLDPKQHPQAAHMIANIRHYYRRTLELFPNNDDTDAVAKPKPVLVVRTHNLWEDIKELDIWLGGSGNFGSVEGSAVTHGSEHHGHQNDLPDDATRQLCCHLLDDMTAYRDLVQRAANLREQVKERELEYLTSRCGASSWSNLMDTCAKLPSLGVQQ